MDVMATATQHPAVVGDSGSEPQHVLSKDDFLKLMLPDSPLVEEGRRKVSHPGSPVPLGSACASPQPFLWSHWQPSVSGRGHCHGGRFCCGLVLRVEPWA